jgi:phosphoribosylglycinamide formyltransferase 1
MSPPLELAVLASGHGSNLRALMAAIQSGSCHANIRCVLSDRASAAALDHARAHGLQTELVEPRAHPDRASWDAALAERVATYTPGLVVLAGFMRLVGPRMLEAFPRRIVNVHPALLPAFPGLDAPAQALRAGVQVSGCTVHLVDAGVDTGPILAQAAVPVHGDDDATSLHARIQRVEHALLPAVVHAVATGALLLDPAPRYARAPTRELVPLISPPLLTPPRGD